MERERKGGGEGDRQAGVGVVKFAHPLLLQRYHQHYRYICCCCSPSSSSSSYSSCLDIIPAHVFQTLEDSPSFDFGLNAWARIRKAKLTLSPQRDLAVF